jgi:hypothetical protein
MAQVKHYWTNADGLPVRFGLATEAEKARSRRVVTSGEDQELVVEFSYDNLPGFDQDTNNDGTFDGFERLAVGIPMGPAGTYLKSATLFATLDWATADTATLTLGTYKQDGTAIDADGIDAAIGAAALDTGDVVACDGAQVGTILDAADGTHYIRATVANTWTTGKAKLVIVYQKLGVPEVAPSKGTVTIV